MKFRQNGCLFLEVQIVLSAGTVVLLWNMFFLDSSLWGMIIPLMIVLLVPSLLSIWVIQEYIFIDYTGISCYKRKRLLWSFTWADIDTLKVGFRFRSPSVEILLKPGVDMQGEENRHNLYFQLSFRSKKALKCYYKWPLPKTK